MAVSVQTSPTFSSGSPRLLFDGEFFRSGGDYDANPDGKQFYFIKNGGSAGGPTQINVALNWPSDFAQRKNQGNEPGQH